MRQSLVMIVIPNRSKEKLSKSKQQFCSRISNKLMDLATGPKAYWSILNTFLNNKIPHEKIVCYDRDPRWTKSKIKKIKTTVLFSNLK